MDGRFCVQVYPNSVLYNDTQALQAVIANEVQMAAPSMGKLKPYTQAFRLFNLSFLFSDTDAAFRFQNTPDGHNLLPSVEGIRADRDGWVTG